MLHTKTTTPLLALVGALALMTAAPAMAQNTAAPAPAATSGSTAPNPSSTSNTTTTNQTQRGQEQLSEVVVQAKTLSLGGGLMSVVNGAGATVSGQLW